MAYDYVQTKDSQNENYINEENNSYKFEKAKMHMSLKHVLEKRNSITEIVTTLQKWRFIVSILSEACPWKSC